MTQGIFIEQQQPGSMRVRRVRPKSKKAIKDAVLANPQGVWAEATSWHGDEYDGPVTAAPDGTIVFCGPDPHTDRRFYGTIVKKGDKITVK